MTTEQSPKIVKRIVYYEPNENFAYGINHLDNNMIGIGIFWHDIEDEQYNGFNIRLTTQEYLEAVKKVLGGETVKIKKKDQGAELTISHVKDNIHFEIRMFYGLDENFGNSMGFDVNPIADLLNIEPTDYRLIDEYQVSGQESYKKIYRQNDKIVLLLHTAFPEDDDYSYNEFSLTISEYLGALQKIEQGERVKFEKDKDSLLMYMENGIVKFELRTIDGPSNYFSCHHSVLNVRQLYNFS